MNIQGILYFKDFDQKKISKPSSNLVKPSLFLGKSYIDQIGKSFKANIWLANYNQNYCLNALSLISYHLGSIGN